MQNWDTCWSSFTAKWKVVWDNQIFRVGWSFKITVSVNGLGYLSFLFSLSLLSSSLTSITQKLWFMGAPPIIGLWCSCSFVRASCSYISARQFFNPGRIWKLCACQNTHLSWLLMLGKAKAIKSRLNYWKKVILTTTDYFLG